MSFHVFPKLFTPSHYASRTTVSFIFPFLEAPREQKNEATKHDAYPLLFDPQTAGGLLAAVPPDQVVGCVASLRAEGYPDACVVGKIIEGYKPGSAEASDPAINVERIIVTGVSEGTERERDASLDRGQ